MQNSLQLSSTEIKMMEEVFLVFSKYAHQTREFGLQLVHSHFSINDNEVLYETHDSNKRILTIKPTSIKKIKKNTTATTWHKNKNGKIKIAMFCCDNGGDNGPPPPPSNK